MERTFVNVYIYFVNKHYLGVVHLESDSYGEIWFITLTYDGLQEDDKALDGDLKDKIYCSKSNSKEAADEKDDLITKYL